MTKERADGAINWSQYTESLTLAKVPEKARRWYVVRVERYLKAHPDLSLLDHNAATVVAYLSRAGQHPTLPGWQFYQVVHALQLFFRSMPDFGWAASFDWQYWLDSSKTLESSHSTVARHNTPVRPLSSGGSESGAVSAASARLIESLVGEISVGKDVRRSALSQSEASSPARDQHPEGGQTCRQGVWHTQED